MSGVNSAANGASLEDCYTNLFALADLDGIKWKKYTSVDPLVPLGPLEDPVLKSYSKCLVANILSVWRKVPYSDLLLGTPEVLNGVQPSFMKELWIYWYGDGPKLEDVILPELIETESGSWEDGLSYECRTLLFKSFHNLIERRLLSQNFVRLGKWFVKPYTSLPAHGESYSDHLSYKLSFFLHGESTVCASVEVSHHQPVVHLSSEHLAMAEGSNIGPGLQVILAPYGLNGYLLEQPSKLNNQQTQRAWQVLVEWKNFYPIPYPPGSSTSDKATEGEDGEGVLPAAVEVYVGGVKMLYPSCYVLVVQDEMMISMTTNTVHSPPPMMSGTSKQYSTVADQASDTHSSYPPGTMVDACVGTRNLGDVDHSTQKVTDRIWHEMLVPKDSSPSKQPLQNSNMGGTSEASVAGEETPSHTDSSPTATSTNANTAPMWNYSDPTDKADCVCSRQKSLKSKQNNSFGRTPSGHSGHTSASLGSNSHGPSSKHKSESKVDKSNPKTPKSSVPFHLRTSVLEEYSGYETDLGSQRIAMPTVATPGTPGVSVNGMMDMKQGSMNATRFPQPSPMQRTPGSVEPSQLNESPPSNSPSPLNPPPNGNLANPLEQPMPTLSPYPPPIGPVGFRTDSLHGMLDTIKLEPVSNKISNPMDRTKRDNEEKDLWSCFALPSQPAGDHKRPRLPSTPYEEDSQDSLMDAFYENENNGERFCQPHKKLRQERRSRSSLDSPVVSSLNDIDRSRTTDFDPYEFLDTSPTSSNSAGRGKSKDGRGRPGRPGGANRRNSIRKERKKQDDEAQRRAEEGKVRQESPRPESVTMPYSNEPFRMGPGDHSSQQSESGSIMQEKDLSLNDFNSFPLFESSSDEDDAGTFDTDFPSSEEGGSKTQYIGNSLTSSQGVIGPYTAGDLGKMYPTPPSYENMTPFSPPNQPCPDLTNLASMGNSQSTREHYSSSLNDPFEFEVEENLGSPKPERPEDWSFVYKVPTMEKIVGATMYAPLKSLPSSKFPMLKVPDYCINKPSSWQLPLSPKPELLPIIKDGSIPMVHSVDMDLPSRLTPSAGILPSPAMYPSSQEPHSAHNGDLQSPASETSSYARNSIEPMSANPIPESHSLYVNLVLSDSSLNLFMDCNFDSAVICVCNMNISRTNCTNTCICGFSVEMNRRYAIGCGLFSEDESEITGQRTDAALWAYHRDNPILNQNQFMLEELERRSSLPRLKTIVTKDGAEDLCRTSKIVIRLLQEQCESPYSSLTRHESVVTKKIVNNSGQIARSRYEFEDGCTACFHALEQGRQITDSAGRREPDLYMKATCLHTWSYAPFSTKSMLSSQDVVRQLRSLQPLLHDAIQKKRTTRLWERPYTVQGPLTWQVFFNMSVKGTSESPEPLPVPPLLVGHDKDWVSSSPYAVLYWEKLLLEPFSAPRDVAYIALVPDHEYLLQCSRDFFKELTSTYQSCHLGRHVPMSKSMRDGILRIGQKYAQKVAQEQVDSWFTDIPPTPEAAKLKLYAQVCKAYVAPILLKDKPDASLFATPKTDRTSTILQNSTNVINGPSGSNSSINSFHSGTMSDHGNTGTSSSGGLAAPSSTDHPSNNSSNVDASLSSPEIAAHPDFVQPPAIIVYVVDPFSSEEGGDTDTSVATLGLLRCFAEIYESLASSENLMKNVAFQIVPMHQVLQVANSSMALQRANQLKTLAFSIYSQCHQTINPSLPGRSLTGFGPAYDLDKLIKLRDKANFSPDQLYSSPYILAPLKDKNTELGESFGDLREECAELFCAYCLSHDQRWLLVACTDSGGEISETKVINIDVPNSKRRKKVSVRNRALLKLWEFLLGVMSKTCLPWRLVIGRFGRVGQGELRDWSALLSRKSLTSQTVQLKKLCDMCGVMSNSDYPCVLSACLVSMEPETGLRIMADSVAADKCSKNSQRDQPSCQLHTPDDATCTHILVFPTSATKQGASVSSAEFAQGGDGDDLFDNISHTIGADNFNNEFAQLFDMMVNYPTSPGEMDQPQPGSPGVVAVVPSINTESNPKNPSSNGESVLPVEPETVLQQPLALAYFISTAKTGPLPKWFWSPCPEAENKCPVFLKAALHINNASVQQTSEDILQTQHSHPLESQHSHPLDSSHTEDVLRYVLEKYNSLSWLTVDPTTGERKSCLPVHMVVLMQLYNTIAALL